MIINKVINNNVLSTHDENNREIVLMGKGIGFQKKVGDEVAEIRLKRNSFWIVKMKLVSLVN